MFVISMPSLVAVLLSQFILATPTNIFERGLQDTNAQTEETAAVVSGTTPCDSKRIVHEQNGITYLYLFPPCAHVSSQDEMQAYVCHEFPDDIIKDMQYLDRYAAQESSHIEVVTCRDPRFEGRPECLSFKRKVVRWYPRVLGTSIVEIHIRRNNEFLAKKMLLFGAIMHKQFHLADYLKGQDIPIGKEHLVATLLNGDEDGFFKMIEDYRADENAVKKLLTSERTDSMCKYLSLVLNKCDQKKLSEEEALASQQCPLAHDVAEIVFKNDHKPSQKLLDFLFTYIKVTVVHLRDAVYKGDLNSVKYLIVKGKERLNELAVSENTMYRLALGYAVQSGNPEFLSMLLDEVEDWAEMFMEDDFRWKTELIIHISKTHGDIDELMELLLEAVSFPPLTKIQVMYAIFSGGTLKTVLWFVKHSKWTAADVYEFLEYDFDICPFAFLQNWLGALTYDSKDIHVLEELDEVKEAVKRKLI